MNIRDLKYLVALEEHAHFGKAAESCFVSQPALSMQLKKLEEYLGVPLLERTNKSVIFTAIGSEMVVRARQVLSQIDEMKVLAQSATDPFGGEFHLGIFTTLAPYLLPKIMPHIQRKFPRLKLYLYEEKTDNLLLKLQQGKCDAAVLALPLSTPGMHSQPLFSEDFLLAVPATHPYANRKTMEVHELRDEELLLLEEGHCLRDQALSFCFNVSAKENYNIRATSIETLRYMVAAGRGMTLMPALACLPSKGVKYIPFKSHTPKRLLGLVWRASSAKETLMKALAEQIKCQ